MSEIVLVFDVETTALCSWNLPHTDPSQPDIIQLAAILSTEEGVLAELSVIINPTECHPEWDMSPETEAIHGITKERILAEGVSTLFAMNAFAAMMEQADTLVCHNTQFDAKLVKIAMHRSGLHEVKERFANGNYYCTMKRSTNLCQIPSPRGRGWKWPKLQELHCHLFGEEFDGAHDALEDVRATMRCFYEMKRRGI